MLPSLYEQETVLKLRKQFRPDPVEANIYVSKLHKTELIQATSRLEETNLNSTRRVPINKIT
jgi:hypothetical protein